jgi:predicted ester cyclase
MDEQDNDAIREFVAQDLSVVFGSNPPIGVDEWLGFSGMMYAAFPDGTHTFEEAFEVDDRVIVRGSFSGTHEGDFMGIPATGNEISVTFLNLDRFADGKLVEHRSEADMLGLMQQIGAIPANAPQ